MSVVVEPRAGLPEERGALDRPATDRPVPDRPAVDRPVPDRASAARAALAAAELRTGVRTPGRVGVRPLAPTVLRPEIATAAREGTHQEPVEASARFWPVHPDLADLLPQGAVQRGTVLVVQGSTALLLALVAEASRAGAWTTMVGHARVGMVAAVDAGIDLERTALVPAPGPDAAAAVGALLDGVDVVVVGPEAALDDADRRRLLGRARERGSVLVAAQPWPGAHVVLTAGASTWAGVDHGAGWLRSRTLPVERAGRAGAARPRRFEVTLPLRPLAPGRAPGTVGGAQAAAGSLLADPPTRGPAPPVLRRVG